MINFHPHTRRVGYSNEHRNNWQDLRDFATEQLRRELTRPTAVQEWLESPEVTAQCDKWRKERETEEKANLDRGYK